MWQRVASGAYLPSHWPLSLWWIESITPGHRATAKSGLPQFTFPEAGHNSRFTTGTHYCWVDRGLGFKEKSPTKFPALPGDRTYMEEVGIKLNLSKCHLGQREVKFLSHVVSQERFKPDPENVEAIVKMKPPTNVKEVRRFMGMCGFYRKHIENFSSLASPLTNLTRKNQPFEWTEECDNAFRKLKDRLTSSPILAKADLTQCFF